MATVEEVLALVRELTPEEQDELIDRLFVEDEDVEPRFDPAYEAELQQRARSFESGEVKGIPWEDVRRRVWGRFGIPD